MATLYNLGRCYHHWDTFFRTDCTAVTKKPLKWGAKNLDAFDAVAFFTDGDLDMDDSQKADLLSFVRDDGKGFIGIHSAAITFLSWPQYGQMLGGYFDGHPWGEFNAPLVVEDSGFPGMVHLPRNFTLQCRELRHGYCLITQGFSDKGEKRQFLIGLQAIERLDPAAK